MSRVSSNVKSVWDESESTEGNGVLLKNSNGGLYECDGENSTCRNNRLPNSAQLKKLGYGAAVCRKIKLVVLCCLTAIVCVVGFLFIQSNITHSYYVGGGAIATSTTIVSDETPDGDYEGQLTNDESGVENSSEMQTSLTGNAEHEEEEKNVLIWVIVSLVAVLVIESYLTYKFWTKYEHKNDKIAY